MIGSTETQRFISNLTALNKIEENLLIEVVVLRQFLCLDTGLGKPRFHQKQTLFLK